MWLAALLMQGCSSTPPAADAGGAGPEVTSQSPTGSNRRVFEGCDPAEEARRYERLAGEKVLITWAWQDTSAASAGLKVPARALRVDPPQVEVTFDPRVPNLELLTSVWLYSGHIAANPDGSFRVDPCSATLEKGGW
jgi:hypothetical protein